MVARTCCLTLLAVFVCCGSVRLRALAEAEALTGSIAGALNLALPATEGVCIPPGMDSGQGSGLVAELNLEAAFLAIQSLASMGCLDAALAVAQVVQCAQRPDGKLPMSVFLPAPLSAQVSPRSLRGIASAVALGGAFSSAQGAIDSDSCTSAMGLIPGDELVTIDDAWPNATQWLNRTDVGPRQVVSSGLTAPPGYSLAVSWLWYGVAASTQWSGQLETSSGAPNLWAVSRRAQVWIEGLYDSVSTWMDYLSTARSVQLGQAAASVVYVLHPWELGLSGSPQPWWHSVANASGAVRCDAVASWGAPPAWWSSSAVERAKPPGVSNAELCLLGCLRDCDWGESCALGQCSPLGVYGKSIGHLFVADPLATSLAILDAEAALILSSLCQRWPSGSSDKLLSWRNGLRQGTTDTQGGLMVSFPNGGVAWNAVTLEGGPGSWTVGGVSVSTVLNAETNAGTVWPLVALASGSSPSSMALDVLNFSAVLSHPGALRLAPSDWSDRLALVLLSDQFALSGYPLSLSSESVWFDVAAGQLGPVWASSVAVSIAGARMVSAQDVLDRSLASALSVLAATGESSGWPVGFVSAADGSSRPLSGSNWNVSSIGLWSAARMQLPRGELATVALVFGAESCGVQSLQWFLGKVSTSPGWLASSRLRLPSLGSAQ
jgi:hypothetical protein